MLYVWCCENTMLYQFVWYCENTKLYQFVWYCEQYHALCVVL